MSKPSVAVVWFREDLRVQDNPALQHACENYDQVIPVYLWAEQDHGDWQPGAASRWWLHHSLQSLRKSLQSLGGDLVIRQGETAGQLLDRLIDEHNVAAVLWNRLYTPTAITRDTGIKESLKTRGIEVRSFRAGLLFEPLDVLKDDGTPYRVFTAFWKRCLRDGLGHLPVDAPTSISLPTSIKNDSLDDLRLLPLISWDGGFYERWQPGEDAARDILADFLDDTIDHYAEERDLPAVTGTSRMSPYLHFGEISPAQIVSAVQAVAASSSSAKSIERYLAEIGWREFAAYTLYHAPHTVSESMDPRFAQFPWQQDDAALVSWQRGQTGLPIIDAGMRELWHTGWMHNRVRMLVASFLTKNLMIHWYEGARWFWDTLVDADLASNTLGWQWVAGCGTDAAPYFRIFNPVLQSQKFDPKGEYIRRWVPELAGLNAKEIHEPWKMSGLDYPSPIVDLKFSRERALETFKTLRDRQR